MTFVMCTAQLFAQVHFTDVVPDQTVDADGSTLLLDLNDDGATDFYFYMQLDSNALFYSSKITIERVVGNGIQSMQEPDSAMANVFYPNRLAENEMIGHETMCSEGEQFISVFKYTDCNCPACQGAGDWTNGNEGYLGLSVKVGSDIYYGWVLMEAGTAYDTYLTIKEYGIAEVPNTPIPAGYRGTALSVPEPEPEEWGIFFVPKEHMILVDDTDSHLEGTEYYICTMDGKKVTSGMISPYMEISTRRWSAGFYFMYLSSSTRGQAVIKFLVQGD